MNQKQNVLGVDAFKLALTMLSGILNTAFSGDRNKDGVIDNTERIALIGSMIPQLFPVFNLYADLQDEIEDKVTSEEFDELIAHVQTLDFLPDGKEEAEKYVKKVFLWINYNRRFVRDSISQFSKIEA